MRAWTRAAARRRVIVNTSEHAVSGILYKQVGPLLVLRDASLLTPGGPATPISGEVLIERSRVEFVQVVGS
jgi:hypothetical protein